MSNHILIKKCKEINKENLSYIMNITEKEIKQLDGTYNFIANNSIVSDLIGKEDNDMSKYKKLIEDKRIDELFYSLSSLDIIDAIKFKFIYSTVGDDCYYGSDRDFVDEQSIRKELEKDIYQSYELYYLGIGKSANRRNIYNKVLKFARMLIISGEIVGRIYFELDADYFKELYENERILSGTKITLVDSNGLIIYDENSKIIGQNYYNNKHEGIVVENQLNCYGWKIISSTSEDYVLDESSTIIQVTFLVAIISIALAVIILSFITKKITEPIVNLTRATTDVMSGNYDVFIDYKSNNEIGILTNSFNNMTSQLKDNLDKEIAHAKALNDAEYKALQAQINPHFMYNSLNVLKWLAIIQKADNIKEVVDSLWQLLSKTSSMKGQFVSLKDEIQTINAYSKIQEVRYKGKYELVYNIDESHMNTIIPKYILQPVVENSIFHGIEPKKGTGTIIISTKYVNNDLFIYVIDDGVGIPKEKIEEIMNTSDNQKHIKGFNNIGVNNVHERLKLLFGEEYGISIESIVGEGTKVLLKIPLNISLKEGD